MNYIKLYCETFDLKLLENKIFDQDNNLIGEVEDKDFVRFTYQSNPVKVSDLFLLSLEEISVHI